MNNSDVPSTCGDETDRPIVPGAGRSGDGSGIRFHHGVREALPLRRGFLLRRAGSFIGEKVLAVPGLMSGSLAHALAQRRLLILMPFALVGGILLYRAARFEPSPVALGLIGLVLFASLWIWRHSVGVFPFVATLCGVWAGAILLPVHGALFGTEMVYGAVYGTYRAQVERIHSDDGMDARIVISHLEPVSDSVAAPLRKARVVVPSSLHVRIGDRIEARLRLYKVPGPVVPGGFDSQFHAYFDGIGAFGTVLGDMEVVRAPAPSGLDSLLQQLREGIGWRIDMGLGQPASGIARALIIGDQSRLEPQVRKDLAAAGLAHVLAISGLHLSLVAGGVFAAVRMLLAVSFTLSRHVDPKKVAALAGMAAALGYLALSGASVSASRATIMLVLVFGAVLAGRKALTMRNVAIAGLVLIIFSPAAIFRPGFQLSFAAVIALVGVYEGYRAPVLHQSGPVAGLVRWIGGIMLTSLIAGAATALFAAYHFQQVAPFGVFGNMAAIPLVALVVLPAGALSLIAMPLGMEGAFLSAMGWGIDRIIGVSRLVAAMGEGMIRAPLLGPNALLLGFAGLAAFAFFPTRLRYGAVAFVVLTVPLLGTMPPPDILVADSTQAIAIRMGHDLHLVKGRAASFAVRAW
ncbi:MAG TPA: ComEC family competence protein, partial [Devosia sp.]|nr:ComEC family competence protein [Devosia sp.]